MTAPVTTGARDGNAALRKRKLELRDRKELSSGVRAFAARKLRCDASYRRDFAAAVRMSAAQPIRLFRRPAAAYA
jgi:hypothetical protein